MFVFRSSAENKKTAEEIEKQQQLASFNTEYESFQKSLMRGTDVISVVNKANNYNEKVEYEGKQVITIKVTMGAKKTAYKKTVSVGGPITTSSGSFTLEEGKVYNFTKTSLKGQDGDIFNKYINSDKETNGAFNTFKKRYFKCDEFKYNEETGRVNYIHFQEVSVDEDTT